MFLIFKFHSVSSFFIFWRQVGGLKIFSRLNTIRLNQLILKVARPQFPPLVRR